MAAKLLSSASRARGSLDVVVIRARGGVLQSRRASASLRPSCSQTLTFRYQDRYHLTVPNLLIRDVATDDLGRIRAAAAARGVSLQAYLRDTLHSQARYLRRQETLNAVAARLGGAQEVPEDEREAVLRAIEDAHASRAGELGDRSGR